MSAENIINNPPKEFTEPCEACGVSEFQLGVKHEQQRIIKLLTPDVIQDAMSEGEESAQGYVNYNHQEIVDYLIALIKDETKVIYSELLPDGTIYVEEVKGEQK